jgi:SET domain-containing protein
LNHSETPNAVHRDYEYYALVNIRAGEEITIDYNSLGEPEDAKEDYYKKS